MKCDYCEVVKGNEPREIIYQDDDLMVMIEQVALAPGEIVIVPKEHYTIFEMLPKKLITKMSNIANKVGVAVFDSLGCQGTNILINNGLGAGQNVPHFALNIIPRFENDNLNLQWNAQELNEADLEDAFIQLGSMTEGLVIEDHDKVEVVKTEGKTEVVMEKDEDDNYLLKSLRRKP